MDLKGQEEALRVLKGEIDALPSQDEGSRAEVIIADVTDVESVKSMVDTAVRITGKLDIMISNAGILKPLVPFLEAPLSDWDDVMAVNARGAYYCYRFAGEQMVKQGHGGRIVGASSVMGKKGRDMVATYSASKFAVRGLTQSAADALGKYGITVNAYAPGHIDTPMTHNTVLPSMGFTKPGEVHATLAPRDGVLGRTGTPDEVAAWVSFIVSDEAGFITGQTVGIDGGMHFD